MDKSKPVQPKDSSCSTCRISLIWCNASPLVLMICCHVSTLYILLPIACKVFILSGQPIHISDINDLLSGSNGFHPTIKWHCSICQISNTDPILYIFNNVFRCHVNVLNVGLTFCCFLFIKVLYYALSKLVNNLV